MNGYEKVILIKISNSVAIPLIINEGSGSIDNIAEVVNESSISAAAGSIFVYQGVNKAVLINYFSRDLMNKIFK